MQRRQSILGALHGRKNNGLRLADTPLDAGPRDLYLTDSYKFDLSALTLKEKVLWHKFPNDFRDFVTRHNGGFVRTARNHISCKLQISSSALADVNIKIMDGGDSLEEIWGFLSYENSQPEPNKPASILHQNFDKYKKETFLPSDVLVFGRCRYNSCVGLSLNSKDYGNVVFWQAAMKLARSELFYKRCGLKVKKFRDAQEILNDRRNGALRDEFLSLKAPGKPYSHYEPIKVADSFTEFINSLHENISANETIPERIFRTNNVSALIDLLDSGYGINTEDPQGCTLVREATRLGLRAMMEILVARGADLTQAFEVLEERKKNRKLLNMDELCDSDDGPIVEFLLKAKRQNQNL